MFVSKSLKWKVAVTITVLLVITATVQYVNANRTDPILSVECTECFYQYNWETYDRSQKMIAVAALVNELTIELGVSLPTIEYFTDESCDVHARYYTARNAIAINESIMYSSVETLKAVSHEMRHVWQYQSGQFTSQFKNYVDSDDEDAYRKQEIEIDANNYEEIIFYDLLRTAGRI